MAGRHVIGQGRGCKCDDGNIFSFHGCGGNSGGVDGRCPCCDMERHDDDETMAMSRDTTGGQGNRGDISLTQLKKLIRETIKQVMTEQMGSDVTDFISPDCIEKDFRYNANCSQQTIHSAPGSNQMWTNWLKKQEKKFFGNAGCYQFGAINKWITKQLGSGIDKNGNPLTQAQIAMKNAQRDWANCMMAKCRVQGATINGCTPW